jgi:hypothetical protein
LIDKKPVSLPEKLCQTKKSRLNLFFPNSEDGREKREIVRKKMELGAQKNEPAQKQ